MDPAPPLFAYDPRLLAELAALCEAEPDRERCGLVVRRGGVLEPVAMENVAAASGEDPRMAFELDPVALLRTLRELREAGGSVAALWHSHVDGQAVLSARDRARALLDGRPVLPGADWIVLGMRAGRVTGIRRWRLEAGAFVEAPLPLPKL